MDFHEWMELSEKAIGKEGMAVFNQFVLGNISFEECLKGMYEVMTEENMCKLARFMEVVNEQSSFSN
jgi:hypothetical protein